MGRVAVEERTPDHPVVHRRNLFGDRRQAHAGERGAPHEALRERCDHLRAGEGERGGDVVGKGQAYLSRRAPRFERIVDGWLSAVVDIDYDVWVAEVVRERHPLASRERMVAAYDADERLAENMLRAQTCRDGAAVEGEVDGPGLDIIECAFVPAVEAKTRFGRALMESPEGCRSKQRDITSGVVPLVVWASAGTSTLGWVLVAAAITPTADALIVLTNGGTSRERWASTGSRQDCSSRRVSFWRWNERRFR